MINLLDPNLYKVGVKAINLSRDEQRCTLWDVWSWKKKLLWFVLIKCELGIKQFKTYMYYRSGVKDIHPGLLEEFDKRYCKWWYVENPNAVVCIKSVYPPYITFSFSLEK